ncbi:MAG: FMN-binding protein [Oceanipulchritudo sp.]
MSDGNAHPQPRMPGSGRLIMALGLIAVMSGLLVVLAFQLTAPVIAKNKQEALEKAIFTVLPQATVSKNYKLDESGLTALPDEAIAEANVFAGYDAGGKLAGLAMEASARGYQDVVRILYGYSLERSCVIGITVLQSTETPGLGDKVETDPDFLANFECLDASLNEAGTAVANPIVTVKNGNKTDPWQIDGISGATVTSTAIGTALRRSTTEMVPLLARYKDSLKHSLDE